MLKKACFLLLVCIIFTTVSMTAAAFPDDTAVENTVLQNVDRVKISEDALKNAPENSIKPQQKKPEINIDEVIQSSSVEATEQLHVTITRPGNGEEIVFKKSFLICGTTDKSDITVALARYNNETGTYEDLRDTDGNSRWDIGASGRFSKEVILKKGENKIKIVAYDKSKADSLKLQDIQVNYFVITLKDETVKEKIISSVLKIADIINDIVK